MRLIVVASLLATIGASGVAFADELQTSVAIQATEADVSTKTSDSAPAKFAVDDFADRWVDTLITAGLVRAATLTDRKELSESTTSTSRTRKSRRHLFAEVHFLNQSIPVLLQVDEARTTCLPEKKCAEKSVITVTGPLASYENVTPHESLESLLRGKQQITWTYAAPTSTTTRTGTVTTPNTVKSEFKVLSLQFERGVMSLLKSRFSEQMSRYEGLAVDQNFVLVGVSRVLREINEGVLR